MASFILGYSKNILISPSDEALAKADRSLKMKGKEEIMINVCTECMKLNSLDREDCHYCGGKCKKVESTRLNLFLIEFNQRKRKKEKEKGE